MTDDATEFAARGGRMLLCLFGGLLIALAIALTVFPTGLGITGLIVCAVLGLVLIGLGVFLPKRARAWLGELIALWP